MTKIKNLITHHIPQPSNGKTNFPVQLGDPLESHLQARHGLRLAHLKGRRAGPEVSLLDLVGRERFNGRLGL